MSRSGPAWLLGLFAASVLLAGALATLYWALAVGGLGRLVGRPEALAGLGVVVAISFGNGVLRWVRWHYLTRRVGIELPARDSLLVFAGTLPAIATPFYLGELVRAVLIGKRYPAHRGDVAVIWGIERLTDLALLALCVALTRQEWLWLAVAGALWSVGIVGVKRFYRVSRQLAFPGGESIGVLLGLTAVVAVLPGVALYAAVAAIADALAPGAALGAYAHSAIVGNLSGLPLGIGVTGTSLVLQLQSEGLQLADAVLCTLVFRVGTVWFLVAFGGLTAFAFRRALLAMLRDRPREAHFDEIAAAYETELPEHVRAPLVERKTRVMLRWLEEGGTDQRGLDVGCGQAWYVCEMARHGYAMTGIEPSARQFAAAQENVLGSGHSIRLERTEVESLPFDDASFDFAYAINVMHHIPGADARERALAEIARVLKPGGVFFLQEINIENPLFRFYMGYVYPLIRAIDEGTEQWISPRALPSVAGADWAAEVDYFTFLPDFLPEPIHRGLAGFERWLESSRFRGLSAHYVAALVRTPRNDP